MSKDLKYGLELDKKIPYFENFIARYSKSFYHHVRNKLITYVLYLEEHYQCTNDKCGFTFILYNKKESSCPNCGSEDTHLIELGKTIIEADIDDVLDFFKNFINKKRAPRTGRPIKKETKHKWRNVLNIYYEYVKEIKEKKENKDKAVKTIFINPVPSHRLYDFDDRQDTIDELEQEADLMTYPIVERILNYLYFTRKRLFIITSLLLYTGARISEICRIKLKNIDTDDNYFYVRVKGKKTLKRMGVYFFPKFFIVYLNAWIKSLQLEYPPSNIYLFPSPYSKGNHISPKTPRMHLRDLKNTLGLQCKINPHAFRDFINTERFDKDMNKKYRELLLNQTPKDVNVKNYLKKYKKRKELQEKYNKTFPFPEFKPKIELM